MTDQNHFPTAGPAPTVPPAPPSRDGEPGLPLTPGQMSVFLAQAADPTSTRFQCAELLVFDDRPDVAVLRATVTDCLDQIEVLHSAVTATPGDDGARLVPHPHHYEVAGPLAPDGAVDLIDWCAARIAVAPGDDADRTSGVDAPFSLSGDMLSGHDLLDLPDGRFAWLARFHHVIADGFAVHVIIRWIAECYTARVAGAASPGVADRFLSHAECLGQAAQAASSPAREADLEYWRDLQFPVSPPVLARHRPTPAPAAPGPRRTYPLATTTLSPDDHRALRTFARDHGVSEATVLAAVTGHYVAAVSGTGTSPGSDPAVLGLPVMGRPAGSRLTAVDPAVTVLPLVVEPHLRPDDSLAAVDRALAGLRRHSGWRAEDIRRVRGVTDPDRLLTGPSLNIRPFSPLFRFGDTRATLTTISTGPVTDLEFIAQSRPDSGLDLQIIGRPTWHTHDDADRHCRGVAAMIRRLVHARPRHWAEIPLRPADHPPAARGSADCATPGSATSADATAAADPTTLTRLLRDARERDLADPDLRRSPGVRSPVGDLDRAERWREVDHLADHLLALGAGPGRTVGIHLRRSPASCMAVVATALTGAAWVPLNPDLPPDRLASMVETCPPDILVTDVGGGGVDTDAPVARLDPSSPRPGTSLVTATGASSDPGPHAASAPGSAPTSAPGSAPTPAPTSTPPRAAASPHPWDTAYVIFTSGSKGRPKGVAVPHRAIAARLSWMADLLGVDSAVPPGTASSPTSPTAPGTASDPANPTTTRPLAQPHTVMQKTPMSFDVSVWELLLPYTHGMCQSIASDGAHRDPAVLLRELRETATTVCHFVPSALKSVLVDAGHPAPTTDPTPHPAPAPTTDPASSPGLTPTAGILPRLRHLVLSGEVLDAATARAAFSTFAATPPTGADAASAPTPPDPAPPAPATPPLTVHNLYGPTEAAVDVTAASFTADTLAAVTEPDGTVAVGTAVPGTRADVVDDLGRPVPVGTPGELILGGIQLATGYVGAPATTAVAFTADPTAGGPPGARVYRTGDVATLRDDGLIVVHGRRDRQVKIRGQRLEPAEVESVITGGPVAACVAVVTTVAGEPTLAAYVVPAPGVDDATAVSVARRRAADALPGSVQPVVRAIASVPVTVNGKVDVAALPSPLEVLAGTGGDADERDSAHPPAPPGTASATERAVADIVARLLEVESVPPTANFFDLGGNSLTAVRLATELRAVLGPGVTVAHVIAGRTPRGIVTAVTGESAYSPIVPLRLRTRDDATSPPAPSQHPLPPPLFCVHPAGGLGWAYTGLLPCLPDGREVFALQSPGLTGGPRARSLREEAELHADLIAAAVAPHTDATTASGPPATSAPTVDLLGWSVGGVLAQETAAVLADRGIGVGRLILLDAYPAETWAALPPPTEEERLTGVLAMAGLGVGDLPDPSRVTLDAVLAAVDGRGGVFGSLPADTVRTVAEMVAHNAHLMRTHHTRRVDATLHVLTAAARDTASPTTPADTATPTDPHTTNPATPADTAIPATPATPHTTTAATPAAPHTTTPHTDTAPPPPRRPPGPPVPATLDATLWRPWARRVEILPLPVDHPGMVSPTGFRAVAELLTGTPRTHVTQLTD
ncbi:AMP-binding protein [Corynebacterium bovis]|uniref:AMP-binding protein n=1 Tax=Corynebacterium bovis TaxID=36808 RepID=UPI003139C1C1